MKLVDLDNLSESENKKFNEISLEIRKDYDKLIETISSEHLNNIHWIVGGIASRNIHQSPLFYRCIQLAFINDIRKDNCESLTIISSDKQLCDLLQDYILPGDIIKCNLSITNQIWSYFRLHRQYLVAIYFLFTRMIGRKPPPHINRFKENAITLLDTFILNKISTIDSLTSNKYDDRYYNSLLEGLDDSIKKYIYFIPTIIGFKNPISIFKKIRKAHNNFLIHDDFLKIKDYFFILSQPFKINKLKLPEVEFRGYQMHDILMNEKLKSSSDFTSLLGLLYYRFTERISQYGLKVKHVVNWYENQSIDRGLIKGFHTFYPAVQVYGYQGYIISKALYLYTQPNRSEYIGGVVPDKVLVTGKKLIDSVKEFCNDIVVDTAPGFRFSKVWRKRLYYPKDSLFSILVGLPLGLSDSKYILKSIINIKNNFPVKDFNFSIKPHPTWSETRIKSLFNDGELDDFIFVDGDFHDNIEKSNLLISNSSSVSLESLAKGVPVIIIAPLTGIVQNPIPNEVSNRIWKITYSSNQLLEAINHFHNPKLIKTLQPDFNDVKNDYFEPVTKQGVNLFLNNLKS